MSPYDIVHSMPELPEVETVRAQLAGILPGLTVSSVDIRRAKSFHGNVDFLLSQTVLRVRRYSKLLVIDVTGNYSVIIHLKMTGRVVVAQKTVLQEWDVEYATDKHTHVVVTFTDGTSLYFHDQRTFGFVQIIPTDSVEQLNYVKTLGPEFFRNLTKARFVEIVTGSTRPIKVLLLDQQKVAGIGNIYANEALWSAKLHPMRKANSLTQKQAGLLFDCLESVMSAAIRWQGASSDNFRDAFGHKGTVQDHFRVYGQAKQPCARCGALIRKVMFMGRGTYVCPVCQG